MWNPALVGLPHTPAATFQIVQFIKDVFLDRQVTIGLLSNVTASLLGEGQLDKSIAGTGADAARNAAEALSAEMLTAEQTAAARDFVNQISGSARMLAHGLLYVGNSGQF